MDTLRSWFEVPAIAHYFHVFSDSFDLIEFEIEDFEEALLVDSSENVSTFLPDLFIRLLRGLYKTKDGLQVTMDNYDHYLQDLLNFHYGVLQKKANPLITTLTIRNLPTRTKVEILYDMINWRLDLEDAMELTKNLEADEMRVEPVGKDNDGNVYWYFYGSRLYKEGVRIKNDKSPYESETEHKNGKSKKRKKKPVALSRSGRAIRKKRKVDASSSSEESEMESEKSLEIPDDESTSSLCKNEHKPIKLNISLHNWSLTCSTLEDWESLMEHLRGATTKNEKQLLTNLKELFEEIPDIINQRETKMQKKLLAMAPRRVSDRITYKMQQRESEDRMLEQERLSVKQHKAEEEEEKLKLLEVEKAEEREKRYKEREKMLEQRSLRAKMREEQKIVRDNPELATTLTSLSPNASPINVRKESISDSEEEEEEDNDFTSMSIVLTALKEHDDAWLFLEPVKEEEAPHYYSYIKNPMDLKTIGEKIKAKVYRDKFEFENDILLIFDNCETYNGTYSPFTKLAFKVRRQFKKLMKREFPPDVHENDVDFGNNDHPTKAKRMKITKNNHDMSRLTSKFNTPQQKKERKPKKEKVSLPSSEVPTPRVFQAKARTVQQNAQKSVASQLSPISATNYLSTRFSIPPYVLKQMSPAQMQSLILRYPRPGFVPALQSLMGHKLNMNSNSASNGPPRAATPTVVGTTTISPLHQLANTALGPPQSPIKPVSMTLPILPKNVTPTPMVSKSSTGVHVFNTSQGQTTPGRPKNILSLPPNMVSQSGGYVSGLSVSGVPVIIQWDELKKQLMAQMPATTSTTSNDVASGKYVSGVTASGAPITIEWEELKKQLVSQMKKDSSTTSNTENIAMSLLHLNDCMTESLVSMAPASTISIMPTLHPVNMPATIPFHSTKDFGITTTTTPTNSKMFSLSNVLKSREFPTSTKPVIIKTPTFDCATSVITPHSVTKTTTPLSNVKLLSGHSKVQDWLKSSSPFIVQNVEGMQPVKNVTSCIQSEMKVKSKCLASVGNTNSIRFVGNQVPSVTPPTLGLPVKDSQVLEYIPKPSFLTPPSKIVPIPLPNVHHITTTVVNNRMNIIPLKGHLASQGRSFSTAVINNKSNILDLQKAALQAAAVNKISSKLQSHLKKDKLNDSSLGPLKYTKTNKVVSMHQPTGNLAIGIIGQRTSEGLNSSLKRETLATSFSTTSYSPISLCSSIVATCLNNFTGNQLINSVGVKAVSESTVPITYSHILFAQNRQINESPEWRNGVASFSSSNQVDLEAECHRSITPQSTDSNPISTTGISKIALINPAVVQSTSSLPFLRASIPSQTSLSVGSPSFPTLHSSKYSQCAGTQLITTLPFTKYSQPAGTQLITTLPSTNYSQTGGTQLITILPSTNHSQSASTSTQLTTMLPTNISQSAGTQLFTTLPSTRYSQSAGAQVIKMLPSTKYSQSAGTQVIRTLPQSAGTQLITMLPTKYSQSGGTQLITMLPSSNYSQPAGSHLLTTLPSMKYPQSIATQLTTTLPSSKYLTFATKPGTMQQSQLSRFMTPASSIISQPNTVRFQTASNNIPVIHPKPTGISKQTTIQKRVLDQPQGQPVRYILPAQTQLPNSQLSRMNQLGSVQNLFLNNITVVKNQMAKNARILSKSLPNGPSQGSANNINPVAAKPNIIISSISGTAFSTYTNINEATTMHNSAMEVSTTLNNQQVQMTHTINNNTVNNVFHSLSKKTNTIETSTICTSLYSTPKIQPNTSLLTSKCSHVPQQSVHMQPSVSPQDAGKLLLRTTQPLSNNFSFPSLHSTSVSGNLKSPDGKSGEKPRHVVLEPSQLQKLKDEGRIVMTANGQLVMIPPNLVGKVPSSVFK